MRKFIGGTVAGVVGWIVLPTFLALALLLGGVLFILSGKGRVEG